MFLKAYENHVIKENKLAVELQDAQTALSSCQAERANLQNALNASQAECAKLQNALKVANTHIENLSFFNQLSQ